MMLLQYDEQTDRLTVRDALDNRDLSPAETETVRNALPAPRMPTGLELAAVVGGMVALAYLAMRIGAGA